MQVNFYRKYILRKRWLCGIYAGRGVGFKVLALLAEWLQFRMTSIQQDIE